ncbi:MAG: LiaI-LiaF-like domain-containing protein [Sphingobacteriaceae bacterium]
MRTDRSFPGIFFIFFGVIFLLNNFGYIDFNWENLFHYWPVFLIIVGVNLVLANNRSPWVIALKLIAIVGGLFFIVFGGFRQPENRIFGWRTNPFGGQRDDNTGRDSRVTKVEGRGNFSEPFRSETKLARLNISGGATKYELNESTTDLFKAETHEFYGSYTLRHSRVDSVEVLDFNMNNANNKRRWDFNKAKSNKAVLQINANPEWEININTGAAELDFDLSKFKINKLQIQGGAASFDIKLGEPVRNTQVEIETGVSEIELKVPENVGCQIITATGLSSKDFKGFTSKEDNRYETENFDTASRKIFIHLKGGVSEFKVKRY